MIHFHEAPPNFAEISAPPTQGPFTPLFFLGRKRQNIPKVSPFFGFKTNSLEKSLLSEKKVSTFLLAEWCSSMLRDEDCAHNLVPRIDISTCFKMWTKPDANEKRWTKKKKRCGDARSVVNHREVS